MPAEMPPYVTAPGVLENLLNKLKEAPPPPRFSQDFLFSNLKFSKSGSTVPLIPFLKKLNFLTGDGTPTDLYKKFRNPNVQVAGGAMATGFKNAYSTLYTRNEYVHNLKGKDLENFLIEALELDPKNKIIKTIMSTMETLKKFANFEVSDEAFDSDSKGDNRNDKIEDFVPTKSKNNTSNGLNLSYTINLNLPESSDIKVFDAIFKSLKEHILNND